MRTLFEQKKNGLMTIGTLMFCFLTLPHIHTYYNTHARLSVYNTPKLRWHTVRVYLQLTFFYHVASISFRQVVIFVLNKMDRPCYVVYTEQYRFNQSIGYGKRKREREREKKQKENNFDIYTKERTYHRPHLYSICCWCCLQLFEESKIYY